MSQWRKKASARLGLPCLVWSKDAKIPAIGYFCLGQEYDGIYDGKFIFVGFGENEYYPDATHWMPLPKAPE